MKEIVIVILMLMSLAVNSQKIKSKSNNLMGPTIITDLQYYDTIISSLNKIWLKGFPLQLDSTNENELTYNPGFLQGRPRLYVKIKYTNKIELLNLTKKLINDSSNIIFKSAIDLKSSLYCFPRISFKSKYKFPDGYLTIILTNPAWCAGQGDRVLGGIFSGIAIDESQNIVVYWIEDLN